MTAYVFSFNISTERGGECELSLSFQRTVFLVLALGSRLCCGLNQVVLLLSLRMCRSRSYWVVWLLSTVVHSLPHSKLSVYLGSWVFSQCLYQVLSWEGQMLSTTSSELFLVSAELCWSYLIAACLWLLWFVLLNSNIFIIILAVIFLSWSLSEVAELLKLFALFIVMSPVYFLSLVFCSKKWVKWRQ